MPRSSRTAMKYSAYRYALSLTSQFYFCGVPFRLDTTPKCELNCVYCFAMSRGGRRTRRALLVDVDKVARKLARVFETDASADDAIAEMLSRRVPVHFGGISEPFADERVSSLSRTLMGLLGRYDYPIVLSTKNPAELVSEKTLPVVKGLRHVVVQISITTPDAILSSSIEPNVPGPAERVRSMERLSQEGIHCICRLQPLLFTEIRKVTRDLIPMLSEAGCKHVVVEYLKLPVEKNISLVDTMLRSLGWNAYDFYKRNGAVLVGREWLLPNRFKWRKVQPVIEAIRRGGMTYGAGDYGLHHLGDTDCCCGLDGLEGFSNWLRGNFGHVIRRSGSGRLELRDVQKHWFPQGTIKMVLNSKCRLRGARHSMLDYLKSKWNSPGTANAPDGFLGVVWDGEYDADGNCVYRSEKVTR